MRWNGSLSRIYGPEFVILISLRLLIDQSTYLFTTRLAFTFQHQIVLDGGTEIVNYGGALSAMAAPNSTNYYFFIGLRYSEPLQFSVLRKLIDHNYLSLQSGRNIPKRR